MEANDTQGFAEILARTLPGFTEQRELWEGSAPQFPSRNSAEWFIKRHLEQLKAAGAVANFLGRRVVRPDKLREVHQRIALGSVEASQ